MPFCLSLTTLRPVLLATGLALALAHPGFAQDPAIDFGDNESIWAHDGECDDPRFTGPGAASSGAIDADRGHDADDCRKAFEDGRVTLAGDAPSEAGTGGGMPAAPTAPEEDDSAETVPTGAEPGNAGEPDIDFGDDASLFSNDGECDDGRFEGPGMTTTRLLDSDIGHDATDCRTAFNAGELTLRPDGPAQKTEGSAGPTTSSGPDDIAIGDFGDDASIFSNDGECDDMRFVGPGMTDTPLLDSDVGHDATDCRTAFEKGDLTWREKVSTGETVDGIDFGDDSGTWSNDGECDDPRFEGSGMTTTPLLEEDRKRDASDCAAAYRAGTITLRAGEQ
ncbi:hypothetical protein [Cucumibacter marinus]|uniref:hypothetical protein n=1 Tax=Cucumibacter marinus TaxID=1121252 RepID=UPI00041A710E|nr:hypothetical protein [Cucumibacter marinus]